MGLHEVIELFANTITMPYEVVQMVLSVTPIFVEATADNLSKHEVMGSGGKEGLQEVSQTMLQWSKVSEATWSPLTAMSSRCSQTATQRALARSKTLTSRVPSNETLDTYIFMAGSKSFAASGSTRDKVVETGTARKVVFGDHADHLVSESPCVPRQNLRMQMSYGSASHIIPRWQLLPRILVKPLDGGESPLCVLEGKGKRRPHLPSP